MGTSDAPRRARAPSAVRRPGATPSRDRRERRRRRDDRGVHRGANVPRRADPCDAGDEHVVTAQQLVDVMARTGGRTRKLRRSRDSTLPKIVDVIRRVGTHPSDPPLLVPSTIRVSHVDHDASSFTIITCSSPYPSLVSPRPLVARPTRRRRRPPRPPEASEARRWGRNGTPRCRRLSRRRFAGRRRL